MSEADLNRANIGKKRKFLPNHLRDKIAKANKSHGEPYRGRNGDFHTGLIPPMNVSIFCAESFLESNAKPN